MKSGTGLRLVVAEAPGEQESIDLEPLVGGSGKRFDALCRAAGVSRDSLTIINTIQCRPPNNVYPTDSAASSYISASEADAAVSQCYKNHVLPVLHSRPWQRVDMLGDKALRTMSKDAPRDGIMNNRGFAVPVTDLMGSGMVGLPTLHPAYVSRDQIWSKVVISDLSKSLQVAPEKYNAFPSLEDVQKFEATSFAFDIENDPRTLEISMVGLSSKEYTAICVPFRGAYVSELRRIFSGARTVVGQNSLQHDEPILGLHGIHFPQATHYDTMQIAGLLLPDLKHGLSFLGSVFLQKPRWKNRKDECEEIYNCRDVDATFQIWQQFLPMLKKEKLLDLYLNVTVPLTRICKMMQDQGVRVEPGRVIQLREKFSAEVKRLDSLLPERLRTHLVPIKRRERAPEGTKSPKTGKVLKYISVDGHKEVSPWRSNDDVAAYLYDDLHLPKQLHIKTKEVTVDKLALERLSRKLKTKEFDLHPRRQEALAAIDTLRALKKVATLLQSFAKEELVSAGTVHTHFRPDGTASGRLSSTDPNLQNQPEKIRYLYVPRNTDWTMVEVDYSGIEARLTAYLADDQARLDKYLNIPNYSEHKDACEVFFGIPYADVVKDNDKDAPYGKAKRIVHGTNYGLGARKLAQMYDLDEREIKQLITKWKAAIPKTTLWQERTAKEAEQLGVLTTPFGRKRWFWTDSVFTESLSFLPQSTAADIIFRAMIGLYFDRVGLTEEEAQRVTPIVKPLPKPAVLLLQVHDSLLFECPKPLLDEVVSTVRQVMEQGWPEISGFAIPIDVKTGESWGEMSGYKYGA